MSEPILKQPWKPGPTVNAVKAAEMLGVSHETVGRLCQEGSLRHFKRTTSKKSHYVIIRQSVLDLAEKWRRQAEGLIPSDGTRGPR